MMIDKQYSAAAQERIDELKEKADAADYAACVVDTAGYRDMDGPVTEGDVERRFEVRSYQHARIYGFPVVYYGKVARARLDRPTVVRRIREAAGPELADEMEACLEKFLDDLDDNPDVAF